MRSEKYSTGDFGISLKLSEATVSDNIIISSQMDNHQHVDEWEVDLYFYCCPQNLAQSSFK